MNKKKKSDIREFESPLPHKKKSLKPAPVAGFIISQIKYVRTLSAICHYRTPRLVKAAAGWYILYYYRVPKIVEHLYPNVTWYRFRLTEDMNYRRGADKIEYADWLLKEITQSLKDGYNPFETAVGLSSEKDGKAEPDVISSKEAFKFFLDAWGKRGIEAESLAKYKRFVNKLGEYLYKVNIFYNDVNQVTTTHIENFLQAEIISNREFNNRLDFIRTCFIFLVKKKIIKESPCEGIDKKPTKSNKHRYFDKVNLEIFSKLFTTVDPYVWFACQTVYHLCIRSDKELMLFKVGNILWDDNKILLDSDSTKGNSARYVPMDDEIKNIFLERGIDKFPADYYVFGVDGEPSSTPFGLGFLSRRFKKVRRAAELPEHFTIYGFKHTRVVHLKTDNVNDADIMSLTGHKDFVSYSKYLRDLGLTADRKQINEKSRRI